MRTEREMTALILGVAEQDARVRAVFMNGSRANPNAPRDLLQDGQGLARTLLPRETLDILLPAPRQLGPQCAIRGDLIHGLRDRVNVVRIHEDRCIAGNFGQR